MFTDSMGCEEVSRAAVFCGKENVPPACRLVRWQSRTEHGREAAGWKPRGPNEPCLVRVGGRAPGKPLTPHTYAIAPFHEAPARSGQGDVEPAWLKCKAVLPHI